MKFLSPFYFLIHCCSGLLFFPWSQKLIQYLKLSMVISKMLFGCEEFFGRIKTMNGIVLVTYFFLKFLPKTYFNDTIHIKNQETKLSPLSYKIQLNCHIFFWLNQKYGWNYSHNRFFWIFTVIIYFPHNQNKQINWIESHLNEK